MLRKAISLTLVFAFTLAFIPMPAKALDIELPVRDIEIGDRLIRATYGIDGRLAHVSVFEDNAFFGAYTFEQLVFAPASVTSSTVFQSQDLNVVRATTTQATSNEEVFLTAVSLEDFTNNNKLNIRIKPPQVNGAVIRTEVEIEYVNRGALDPNSRVYQLLFNTVSQENGEGKAALIMTPMGPLNALREAVLSNSEFAALLQAYLKGASKTGMTRATPAAIAALLFVLEGEMSIAEVQALIDAMNQQIIALGFLPPTGGPIDPGPGLWDDCWKECWDQGLSSTSAQLGALAAGGAGCTLGGWLGCVGGAAFIGLIIAGSCSAGCSVALP